jgi:hypothetical protein
VKIIIPKLVFAAALSAAVLAFGVKPSRAGSYGDEKWCAVSDDGDHMVWDCEFDTADDCTPAILVGNRGFCAINPYWQPPQPSTNSQR